MDIEPTAFDIWFVTRLARLIGRHPLFDLGVQSAIRHNILGGFWFAASLFILWTQTARSGQDAVRRRLLTTLAGSLVAILFSNLAGALISWLPPCRHPALARFYPDYIEPSPSFNCFPSQSTTLYSSVASGIYSQNKIMGSVLWVLVGLFVALPRIYIGGHYPSDAFAGVTLGMCGYVSARYFLEPRLIPYIDHTLRIGPRRQVILDLIVFLWILQVAIEFVDATWIKNGLVQLFKA